jgi:HK97 gp10 family phage protein
MKRAIDPQNLARVLRKFDRVREAIEVATTEELQLTSQSVVDMAKQLCPVGETGNLRRSIRWEWKGEMATRIGSDVDYAPDVEFGTRDRPAQPFLFPAFDYNEPIFRQTLNQRVSNELRKVRKYL